MSSIKNPAQPISAPAVSPPAGGSVHSLTGGPAHAGAPLRALNPSMPSMVHPAMVGLPPDSVRTAALLAAINAPVRPILLNPLLGR